MVFDIYSKRRRRELTGDQDVYVYDHLPEKLRKQIIHIINEAIGTRFDAGSREIEDVYRAVIDILIREYGVFSLVEKGGHRSDSAYVELTTFLLHVPDTDECLDSIELCFALIDRKIRKHRDYRYGRGGPEVADKAIKELNVRFRENGAGYQFTDGQIIRVDSELLHKEAVKPALQLLGTAGYEGPHEEFLLAYGHFRKGENKEALNFALKAFESTMKAICDKRGWTYDPAKDTSKKLIEILFENGLIPEFWQNQFSSLRSLLESSVPTGRNKLSGHGQGAVPQAVPDYLTAYMLHMTASTLVFLTTAEKELPPAIA